MGIVSLYSALITEDGFATGLSEHIEKHPLYGTDSRELKMIIPLTEQERELAAKLHRGAVMGKQQRHVRSALCQLGVDAFDLKATSTRMIPEGEEITTLITSLSGEDGYRVIDQIEQMIGQGREAYVGRASLLPAIAKLRFSDVKDQMENGDIRAQGAKLRPSGILAVPPMPVEYRFDLSKLSDSDLQDILAKHMSGRGRISQPDMRTELPTRPKTLEAGQFFVGKIDLNIRLSHAILGAVPEDAQGNPTKATHNSALAMDGGRTQDGDRQVEVRANGHPVDLDGMWFPVELYRAAKLEMAGV
jgi:hypothetical protein